MKRVCLSLCNACHVLLTESANRFPLGVCWHPAFFSRSHTSCELRQSYVLEIHSAQCILKHIDDEVKIFALMASLTAVCTTDIGLKS